MGRPFVSGDARRGPGARRGGETARSLARKERGATIARLAALRDQDADLELALAAAELLLRYSDGEPGVHNVPAEPDETMAESGELAKVLEMLTKPPETETAPGPVGRGGDSGDEGQGNGGAA